MNRHLFTSLAVAMLLLSPQLATAPADEIDWAVYQRIGRLEFFIEYPENAPGLAAELDSVAGELQQKVGLAQPADEVQVIVFRTAESYRAYLKPRIPEGVTRRAIYYREGDMHQIYAYRSTQLITDLRHEFTHAYLHQQLPYVPLWVDEGLAEYFEERPAARQRSSRLTAMKWRCRTGQTPRLQNLEQLGDAQSMTSAHYRDSWAWIYFLLTESDQSRALLSQYLQAISAGEAPGSFTSFEGDRQLQVTNRMGSYFRRFRFSLR